MPGRDAQSDRIHEVRHMAREILVSNPERRLVTRTTTRRVSASERMTAIHVLRRGTMTSLKWVQLVQIACMGFAHPILQTFLIRVGRRPDDRERLMLEFTGSGTVPGDYFSWRIMLALGQMGNLNRLRHVAALAGLYADQFQAVTVASDKVVAAQTAAHLILANGTATLEDNRLPHLLHYWARLVNPTGRDQRPTVTAPGHIATWAEHYLRDTSRTRGKPMTEIGSRAGLVGNNTAALHWTSCETPGRFATLQVSRPGPIQLDWSSGRPGHVSKLLAVELVLKPSGCLEYALRE